MNILILGLYVVLYLAVGIAVVKTRLYRWMQWHLEERATCFPNDGMSFVLIEDDEQDIAGQCRSAREYCAYSDRRNQMCAKRSCGSPLQSRRL